MAIVIQRIEKDFLLGMLRYKSLPLKCIIAKKEYTFILQSLDNDRLVLKSEVNLSCFQKNMKIEFKFPTDSVLAPIVSFSVYVCDVTGKCLTTTAPDCLYKNLQRSYSRVLQTPELNIAIKKDGFYYDLNYAKVNTAAPLFESCSQNVDENNIETYMNMNLDWIKQQTNGYKLVLFKNDPPVAAEEKAVGQLGKIFYFSMPDGGLVSEPENSMDLFFTEQSFKAFLVDSGMSSDAAREKIMEMLQQRVTQGVCSDCFIPIVFSSYIVGYVHVWVYENSKVPLTMSMVEKIRQFTSIIAFFLEHEHFFEEGKKSLPVFKPKLLDVSASGFLFAIEINKEKTFYALNDVLTVTITISNRAIYCKAVVIREYTNKTYAFYGCKFEDMKLEDIRFFFESIYGKPFTDKDLDFIVGSV
jgi:hypothetical protein